MGKLLPAQIIAVENVLKPHMPDQAISVMGLFLEALDAFTLAGPAKRSRATKGATRLPDGVPDHDQKARACESWRSVGRHDLAAKVEEIAQAFRDYHLAHGSQMESWGHAWATWYKRQVEYHKPTGQLSLVGAGGTFEPTSLEGWIKRLEMLAGRDGSPVGTWRASWGPKPGAEGCKVPPEAGAEYRRRYPKKA